MLDVREWYKAGEGEIAPTKKGVRIDLGALLCIKAHLPNISAAQEAAAPAATSAASRSAGEASTSAAAAAGVPKHKQADPKPAANAGAKGQEQAGDVVELGGKKRMRATAFKGKTYVDFREFYEVRVMPPVAAASDMVAECCGECLHHASSPLQLTLPHNMGEAKASPPLTPAARPWLVLGSSSVLQCHPAVLRGRAPFCLQQAGMTWVVVVPGPHQHSISACSMCDLVRLNVWRGCGAGRLEVQHSCIRAKCE
jgi:hypothetical protein